MNSLILRTASLFVLPLLLVFSFILLIRGHNLPGGGFVGGLMAAAAFALHAIAYGPGATRELLRIDVKQVIGIGLAIAFVSLLPALFFADPFFTGQWFDLNLATIGIEDPVKLGTPLVFDVGVYLTVVGTVLLFVFTLAETA